MKMKTAITKLLSACTAMLTLAAAASPVMSAFASGATDYLTDGNFYFELKDDNTYVITDCIATVVSEIPEMSNGLVISEIGDSAFINCTGITEMTIPDTVKTIGQNAFYGCTGLSTVRLPSKLTTIADGTFTCCSSLTSVTVPDSVTTIGNDAFRQCDHLTEIDLPDTITSIGEYAFYECTSLRNIELPDQLTNIGRMAFGELLSLESYDTQGCSAFTCENNVLMNKDKNEIYASTSALAGDLIIPDGVRDIKAGAFSSSPMIEYVHIPSTVTTIDDGAFCNMLLNNNGNLTMLKNIDFSEGLTNIGEGAFRGTSVETLSLPTTLKAVGIGAFENCINLKSVILSEGVESIGEDAFFNCTSLKRITLPKSIKQIGEHAFGYDIGADGDYSKMNGFKMSVFSASAGAKYAKSNDIEYVRTDNLIKRTAFIVVAVGLVLAVLVFAVVLMRRSRKSPKLSEKIEAKKAKEKEEEDNYKSII